MCALLFCDNINIYDIAAVQFVPFKPDIYTDDSRVFSLEDIGELPSTSSAPYNTSELGNVLSAGLIGIHVLHLNLTDLVNGLIIIRI